MARITEVILEPSEIYVNQRFKIKVKVEDFLTEKRVLITETDNHYIITENGDIIRTEWGE